MKYFTPDTDLTALQRELRQSERTEHRPPAIQEEPEELADPYAEDQDSEQDSYQYDDRRR